MDLLHFFSAGALAVEHYLALAAIVVKEGLDAARELRVAVMRVDYHLVVCCVPYR